MKQIKKIRKGILSREKSFFLHGSLAKKGCSMYMGSAERRCTECSTLYAEAWREMLEVNVLALAIATREAVSDMKRRGDNGCIIHISSMSAHRVPTGTGGMYSATKHAVRAMTEALRRELRPRSLSPGQTK